MPIALTGTPPIVVRSWQAAPVSDTLLEAVRYKVTCRRPLCVRSEADEKKGTAICDLMQGERVSVLESRAETRPDGSVRCPIVDPVWMGWLTLTTKTKLANLEPAPAAAATRASTGDGNATKSAAADGAPPIELSDGVAIVVSGAAASHEAPSPSFDSAADGGPSSDDPEVRAVLAAAHPYATLGLPLQFTADLTGVRKAFRRVSLAVHPDKTSSPGADAAFRKAYGAFEALCDLEKQRRLLADLQQRAVRAAMSADLAEIQEAIDRAGIGDDDDEEEVEETDDDDDDDDTAGGEEWWRAATVAEMAAAADEAEGADMDALAATQAASTSGGAVDSVGWISAKKAMRLQRVDRAIFIDCRESDALGAGCLPGAFHVPMSAALRRGVVDTMGKPLIDAILTARKHALIVVYSEAATPFSRCRAFCRLLLHAGSQTVHPLRCRRLAGGVVGWKRKGGQLVVGAG